MFNFQKTDDYFSMAREAIHNGMNYPEISELLSHFGYDPKKIYEGQLLYEKAYQLYQNQQNTQQERVLLKNQLNESLENLEKKHQKVSYMARILSTDDPKVAIKLGMNKKKKLGFSGRTHQIDLFYQNLLNDSGLMEKYAAYNISTEDIQAVKNLLDETMQLRERFNALKSEAQQATEDKNTGIKKLKEWMKDYQGIARYALKNKPQYLEKLGILVRSKAVN